MGGNEGEDEDTIEVGMIHVETNQIAQDYTRTRGGHLVDVDYGAGSACPSDHPMAAVLDI